MVSDARKLEALLRNDFRAFLQKTLSSLAPGQCYTQGSLSIVHPAPKGGAACRDPRVNSDDNEAVLDVEWASAAAPNAEIVLASCEQAGATDGVTLAIENLVDSANPPPIISVSYGICEA